MAAIGAPGEQDGLVGGVFRDRAEAERFARLEEEIQPPQSSEPRVMVARPLPDKAQA